MIKLAGINTLADNMAERIGIRPTITTYEDYDVLSAFGNDVLVSSMENGDWVCRNIQKPHWHQDDGILHEHFFETVATLLKGEKACDACP